MNDQERQTVPLHSVATMLAMDECHMEQVKSVFECIHSISCMAMATEVGISPAFTVPSSTAWGNEKFVRCGLHTCTTMTNGPHMFLPPHICSCGDIKAVHSWITF